MRNIKDILPKPSDAIQAMIDGLKKYSKKEGFVINMGTYGSRSATGNTCFGCAATCAAQVAMGVDFTYDNIWTIQKQAECGGVEKSDLVRFEDAIDDFRIGMCRALFKYYGLDITEYHVRQELPLNMTDEDWEEQIPTAERYRDELIKIGL